ncbi:MAG: hypothetical protein IPL49_06065 [Saprospirales bacterium]|nr:hypothetical protein [Saprospirales bacterium]MBK8490471.1 hypothetical protein [Saprospirales bacterium]
MRKLVFLSLLFAFSLFAQAQEIPRFQKFTLSDSGFQAYLPSYPDNLEVSWSEDSAKIWTGEVEANGLLFGLICVEFSEPLDADAEMQVALLESYLDYLQSAFSVEESTGYGYGHTLDSNPDVSGILDYWVDSDGYTWNVKGWVNQKHLAVLYVGGGEEDPEFNSANLFLNGIRFPQ